LFPYVNYLLRGECCGARLNDVDPQARLADVLAHINDHSIHRLEELLPWNWKSWPGRLAACRLAA
jgi:hypothetical protein